MPPRAEEAEDTLSGSWGREPLCGWPSLTLAHGLASLPLGEGAASMFPEPMFQKLSPLRHPKGQAFLYYVARSPGGSFFLFFFFFFFVR